MAKVELNPIFDAVHGKIGDLVLKQYGGDTLMTRLADPTTRAPSAAQLAHQERFRQAAAYGKQVLADPALRAEYLARAQALNLPLFALTVADFFNKPVVTGMDLSAYHGQVGETIRVYTRDEGQVVKVHVTVANEGTTLEQGEATETAPGSGEWEYTTTTATGLPVTVTATATDRAGNVGSLQAAR